MDLALNNPWRLICHQNKETNGVSVPLCHLQWKVRWLFLYMNLFIYLIWSGSRFYCMKKRLLLYHRTNVLCCKERSPQKKKYSNSKVREENIAVVYYSAMIAATRKVHFSCVLLLPSSWWWRGGGESWLLTHACHSKLCRVDRGLGTFDSPVLKAAFNSAKISLHVFLYRDFGEQIEDPQFCENLITCFLI